ncbi:MAG: inositol monophosphatase [Marinicaulis sp.]|nr:inositol monophosphatase [Marinicaulis sp.]NNL89117.1 inositol monophosphatase [Marinicaulis sp.]
MIVDPERVAAVVREIADEEVGKRFGKLQAGEIDTKSGPNDYVTLADRAAETKLERALSDIYPAAGFIGEESAAADPAIVDALHGDGSFWIVDPLDGTRNFVQGRKEFGSIIALVEDGELRQGWIYAIPDGKFAIGSVGDGVIWDGDKLGPLPSAAGRLKGSRAIGNIDDKWKPTIVANLRSRLETESIPCAAYSYLGLLQGKRDFALYSRCSPWDHVAGILMLREIGGEARYIDKNEPYSPPVSQGRPMLVAGSQDRYRRVCDQLLGGIAEP